MIQQILVDMDGVLSNFFDAALSLWGYNPKSYPPGEWEIPNVLQISNNEFWARIDECADFWRSLEPYSWTFDLIAFLDSTKIPWAVSTSPSLSPQCAAQKVEWMRRHISPSFTNYMIGKQKNLMANPSTLLIDDGPHNIDRFAQAGGATCLWPAIWNHRGHSADPLGDVVVDLFTLGIVPA